MHEADNSQLTPQAVVQDVLDSNISNNTTGSSQSAIHFHTLKAVRQLGGNFTSFPTAAEVRMSQRLLRVCVCPFLGRLHACCKP